MGLGGGGSACTMGNKFKFALSLSAVSSGLLITSISQSRTLQGGNQPVSCSQLVLHFAMVVVKVWLEGGGGGNSFQKMLRAEVTTKSAGAAIKCNQCFHSARMYS